MAGSIPLALEWEERKKGGKKSSTTDTKESRRRRRSQAKVLDPSGDNCTRGRKRVESTKYKNDVKDDAIGNVASAVKKKRKKIFFKLLLFWHCICTGSPIKSYPASLHFPLNSNDDVNRPTVETRSRLHGRNKINANCYTKNLY